VDTPFHIQWHITNLCNLRCKHCYQEDFSKNSDLDWPELKYLSDNILATLKEWDRVAYIHLTGGEPLLKRELIPLLHYLGESPWVEDLGLITNGLHLNQEMIEKLTRFPKLKKVKISLDGADAETNDSVRQTGVFEKVIAAIPRIKKETRFEVILMFTLMRSNFRHFRGYVQLGQDLGIDGLIFERFVPWGRGRDIMDEVLDKAEWNEFRMRLFEFFSMEEETNSTRPYQAFQVHFGRGEMELSGAPCIIGVDGLCIMPDGNVFPCRRFPISIGNLLQDSLGQLWQKSEILEALRKKENLKGKCGRCGLRDCRGCRSLALSLSGDYLEEDPLCGLHFH
jgi:radical SAM protein with 4Fe4S-binding SPASM domain